MSDMRLVVMGAGGRMGRALVKAITEAPGVTVSAALERAGSPALGKDAGDLAGVGTLGVPVTEDALKAVVAADGMWVRYGGAGKPPVTDGPFAETKDLIAGWMVIDVDSEARAIELAGELSAAPGPGSEPIYEWIEIRPFLALPETFPG